MSRRLTLILPSTATISSLVFGVLAIMVLADGNFLLAAILITLGSILDVLDGQLAARLNVISVVTAGGGSSDHHRAAVILQTRTN